MVQWSCKETNTKTGAITMINKCAFVNIETEQVEETWTFRKVNASWEQDSTSNRAHPVRKHDKEFQAYVNRMSVCANCVPVYSYSY